MKGKYYDKNLLVEWREDLGLSQEEVASELNVARNTINRVENGHGASDDVLYALCDFYRKPITALIVRNKFAPKDSPAALAA